MVDRPSKNTNVARECAQLSLKFLCIKKNIEEEEKARCGKFNIYKKSKFIFKRCSRLCILYTTCTTALCYFTSVIGLLYYMLSLRVYTRTS